MRSIRNWRFRFDGVPEPERAEHLLSIAAIVSRERRDLLFKIGACCLDGETENGDKITTPSISEVHRHDGHIEIVAAISGIRYTLLGISEDFHNELKELNELYEKRHYARRFHTVSIF